MTECIKFLVTHKYSDFFLSFSIFFHFTILVFISYHLCRLENIISEDNNVLKAYCSRALMLNAIGLLRKENSCEYYCYPVSNRSQSEFNGHK